MSPGPPNSPTNESPSGDARISKAAASDGDPLPEAATSPEPPPVMRPPTMEEQGEAFAAPPVHAPPREAKPRKSKPPRRTAKAVAKAAPKAHPATSETQPSVADEETTSDQPKRDSRKEDPDSDSKVSVSQIEAEVSRVPKSDLAAVATSAMIHALVLLFLATFVVPMVTGQSAVTLLVTSLDEESGAFAELDPLELEAPPEEPTEEITSDINLLEMSTPEVEIPIPDREEVEEPEPMEADGAASETTAPPTAGGAANEATSVETAVDGITAAILGELQKGDLLVVWLFDASHSLVDDRKRVAERLTPFFEDIDAARSDSADNHQLMNAVVSFGATTRERIPPTKFGPRIVGAVKKLPVDASGKENVFAAITQCATNYRKKWREKSMMIVVWTDESGDDAKRVEQTISICQQQKVMVSVVGPSSVLGAKTGLHSYTDEKSKRRFLLPVDRGPDSAQAERLAVGYWFKPRLDRLGGRTGAMLPSWYGGDDMQGVASGFSPYALTRLAAQTNGTYTIFDRPEDRGPFRFERMAEYAPSYSSLTAYEGMVREHPLRQAVMQAVEVTQGEKLLAPETMLFVKRNRSDPTQFERPYMSPGQFAAQLRSRKRGMQAAAARMSETIEAALKHVSADGNAAEPLDSLYEQEDSRRWRAWYDLTRGRLLAVSVRLEEYRLALDAFTEPGFLREPTNHLILYPQQNLRSEQTYRARAIEAEQLLMRCIERNADTPWAYLAQRELANGLGVRAQQVTLRLVRTRGPAARPGSPSLPKF